MTDLRAAAQQALEALDGCVKALDALHAPGDSIYTRASDLADRAEIALRAALAQQEPRNQCGETCERATLCAVCARGLEQEEQGPDLCWTEAPNRTQWGTGMMEGLVALGKDHTLRLYAEREALPLVVPTLKAALAQPEQELLSVEDLARALVASRVIDAAAIDDPEGYDDGVMLERVRGLHRRLAALAQQEQDTDCHAQGICQRSGYGGIGDITPAELSAGLGWPGGISTPVLDKAELLRMVASGRVEQEPVAWNSVGATSLEFETECLDGTRFLNKRKCLVMRCVGA